MKEHNKGKLKIIITFVSLFLIVSLLLVLIFYAGKKTYTVRFDLNGGTLISGSLEQHVTQGQSATPPVVYKDGAYLRGWSAPYNQITKDVVITAVWEYETTAGIIHETAGNQNYAEIVGAYKYIRGEVYLGAYYGEKKVLGIRENAFSNCVGITKVYLLQGLIHIGDRAFSGCTGLVSIEIPKTVTHLGEGAFEDCSSLETLVLNEGLLEIGKDAFKNCSSLKELVLPKSIQKIDVDAFEGCDGLVIKTSVTKDEMPEGWAAGWQGTAGVIWIGAEDVIETEREIASTTETETETDTETETETEGGIRFPIFRPSWQIKTETTEPEESVETETDGQTETESTTESETEIDLEIKIPIISQGYPIIPEIENRLDIEDIVKGEVETFFPIYRPDRPIIFPGLNDTDETEAADWVEDTESTEAAEELGSFEREG